MIQDIKPHTYNNHFENYYADAADFCVQVQEGKILLEKQGKEWGIPTFSETGMPTKPAVYLFSIDEKRYFLIPEAAAKTEAAPVDESCMEAGEPEQLQDGAYSWKNRRDLREIGPRVVAFAVVTALQLAGWYRSNNSCSCCGQKLIHDSKERMLRCPSCGNQVYPRINPAVIVGVWHHDKLLMTKYAGRTYTRYALIAGFTEIGETLEETVAREVMEEVGVAVKNIRYYKSQPWSFSDTLLVGFFCEADGQVNITLDTQELSVGEWIERDKINQAQESFDTLSLTNEMIEYFRDHEESFVC